MEIPSEKFVVEALEWHSPESGEFRPLPPPVGVLDHAHVACKACGHEWFAEQTGSGRIRDASGCFKIHCPECGANEEVPYALFNQSTGSEEAN